MQAAGLHVLEAIPADLADVQQAVAASHELNECTELEDADHLAGVDLTLLGNCGDGLDAGHGSLDALLVGSSDLDDSLAVNLLDADGGAGLFLQTLDDFTTLADNGTNEFLVDNHGDDAGHVGLVVLAGSGNGLVDEVEDVETAFLGLVQCLLENLVGQTVALDIHLSGGDTVDGTRHLEVHVAQVVLIAQDVAQHGVLHVTLVGDQTHCDTCNGLLELDTGVEQCHAAGAHGSHRRRTVTAQDVAHDADAVGVVLGDHALEGAVCQVAVTDLAAAHATGCAGLTGREGGEVVVQQEALVLVTQHVVDELLVVLGAQGDGGQGLGLATLEQGRAVGIRQIVGLAQDGTDLVGLAAIQADVLVEDATANGVALHFLVIALDHRFLLLALLLGDGLHEVVIGLLEGLVAPLLVGLAGLSHSVALGIDLLAHALVEFLVVGLVAVLALGDAQLLGPLLLDQAHGLDSLMGSLQGGNQVILAHFVHFALDHHNIIVSRTYHQFHVSFLNLLKRRVDNEFAVDACNAHLGNGLFKRHIAHCDGSRCGKTCQGIGGVNAVAREHQDVNDGVGVIIRGEQGPEHTVNKTRGQDLVVAGATLATGETAGETAIGGEFLLIFNSKGHEVHALVGLLGRTYGGQQHRVVEPQFNSSIGLLSKLSSLQSDLTSVTQYDGFCSRCHKKLL